jgi:hypothetical protein
MAKTSGSGNRKKVIKYRRKPKAAAAIFAVILFYIVAFIAMYLSKSKVQTYEVELGSLTSNATFTGIALRTEQIVNSSYSGNINYYQKEGGRVKVGDTVYTVDETGRVSEILSQYKKSDENSLSKQDLSTIKSMLNNFKTDYDGSNFGDIYDLKTDLNSAILQSMNESIIANLDSIVASTGSQNLFQTINAEETGIVAYYTDGYESVTPETLNSAMFDKNNYKKNNLKTEDIVVKDNPAYKLITDETWYICIPLSKTDIDKYDLSNKSTVSIKILKDNITVSCPFTLVNNGGEYFGKMTLEKYMVRYVTERFVDIELNSSSQSGLKIPASAVTDQSFYVIPKAYLTSYGTSSTTGVLVEGYSAGELISYFNALDIYKSTDDYAYITTDALEAGTTIIKPDSSEKYVVSATEKLKGVYCINTGYTVFKLVDIIDQNNEYIISRKGISYGISVYDRIILNADNYEPNQMVY